LEIQINVFGKRGGSFMDTHIESLRNFLNTGWGKRATQYLKEGATFKVLVDEDPFSLSKQEGKMEVCEGVPKRYDVLLEISSPAIGYLSGAKTQEEAQERLDQLIYHSTPEKYARMKIEVEPTEKARIDFYWQGFFFWARRMGFVS
jgi:hypothetical protein